MADISLHKAFVLHTRPYRDSSLLVDLLTDKHGRITVVSRSARNKKSLLRGLLQAFVPLWVSYAGRGELMTLKTAEIRQQYLPLQGKALLSGFYLNELLSRLLAKQDACPEVFDYYEQAIISLAQQQAIEPILRQFEWQLLQALGYGISLELDALDHSPVQADGEYYLLPEKGVCLAHDKQSKQLKIPGQTLLDLYHGEFSSNMSLQGAKQLTRQLLKPLLGDKPLHSRTLFT